MCACSCWLLLFGFRLLRPPGQMFVAEFPNCSLVKGPPKRIGRHRACVHLLFSRASSGDLVPCQSTRRRECVASPALRYTYSPLFHSPAVATHGTGTKDTVYLLSRVVRVGPGVGLFPVIRYTVICVAATAILAITITVTSRSSVVWCRPDEAR